MNVGNGCEAQQQPQVVPASVITWQTGAPKPFVNGASPEHSGPYHPSIDDNPARDPCLSTTHLHSLLISSTCGQFALQARRHHYKGRRARLGVAPRFCTLCVAIADLAPDTKCTAQAFDAQALAPRRSVEKPSRPLCPFTRGKDPSLRTVMPAHRYQIETKAPQLTLEVSRAAGLANVALAADVSSAAC
jgi:hypothetical protein